MSIEAFTCEEIKIFNNNEKTAKLAEAVGNYLIKNCGIVSLELTVDQSTYKLENADCIEEIFGIYDICKKLSETKEISIFQRSVNGSGVAYRLESSFMKYLTDDEELRQNVIYRSTDYYDTDDYVDMYLYNENGLQKPEYNGDAEAVRDIDKWFCFTPTVHIFAESHEKKTELYEKAIALFGQIAEALGFTKEELESHIEDDWAEYGELSWYNSTVFTTENIRIITDIGNQLRKLCEPYDDIDFAFELSAVPDGENDYDFASVNISCVNGEIVDRYCRF